MINRNLVGVLFIVLGIIVLGEGIIMKELAEVKQGITELRKDFSYDPKDAK